MHLPIYYQPWYYNLLAQIPDCKKKLSVNARTWKSTRKDGKKNCLKRLKRRNEVWGFMRAGR